MSTIITVKQKILQAELFKAALIADPYDTGYDYLKKNMYLFVGRSYPWENDTEPPTTVDNVKDELERWNNMIALKKIIDSDVMHGIRRHDWDATGNTKYFEYADDDADLFNHPTQADIAAAGNDYTAGSFYVMTDEYHVYKCISNNGFVKSTSKPTGTSADIIETEDGYRWKYMLTVTTSQFVRFATPDFIPIQTLTTNTAPAQWSVQTSAVDGAVDHIRVEEGGSGWVRVHSGTSRQTGGANTIYLEDVPEVSGDDHYYNGSTIFIDDGTNSNQARTITAYDGLNKVATVTPNWTSNTPPDTSSVYTITPRIVVSGGGGTGLIARAYTNAGAISKVEVVEPGSGYRFADAITLEVRDSISGATHGTGAEIRAVISPIGGHGKNPVEELGGYYTITNVKLDYNETDFITKNDYRITGIVSGVCDFNTTTLSTANTLRATKILVCSGLNSGGSFDEDEEILGGTSGAKAIVVESNEPGGAVANIQIVQNSDTGFTAFTAGETITGQVSGATATLGSITNPEIALYQGRIIHVEQRRPLMRDPEQYEDSKIVIEH